MYTKVPYILGNHDSITTGPINMYLNFLVLQINQYVNSKFMCMTMIAGY